MKPEDPRVLCLARALVAILDALASERQDGSSDELVPIAKAGIERRALRRLVQNGKVRAMRLGRRLYVSRADLASLLPCSDAVTPEAIEVDPRQAAAAAYGRVVVISGRRAR
jgi:hypothetical protein